MGETLNNFCLQITAFPLGVGGGGGRKEKEKEKKFQIYFLPKNHCNSLKKKKKKGGNSKLGHSRLKKMLIIVVYSPNDCTKLGWNNISQLQ